MNLRHRIYLDWNATQPLRPQARAAVVAALDAGNASAIHAEGRHAKALLETARQQVADLVGAQARQVVFTAGATEANNLALSPHIEAVMERAPRDGLVVAAIEHSSVLAGHRFVTEPIEIAGADANGVATVAAVAAALDRLSARGSDRPLVAVMAANNETGVIQPVAAIAALVHARGGLLQVDATQAVGRIPFNIKAVDADLVTLSSHKLGGPKGAGALVLGPRVAHLAAPLVRGGGQERGRRAGTEDVAAIAGFGVAAVAAAAELPAAAARMTALRDALAAALKAVSSDAVILGEAAERLPNTVLVGLPGLVAETAVIAFDLAGIAVSSGAACASGKVGPSHVVQAMGREDLARASIRLSLGPTTTQNDINRAVEVWRDNVTALSIDRRGNPA